MPSELASISIIDTFGSKESNIVEFMLSFNEFIHNIETTIAGLALFIHGDHDLALNLRKRFLKIKNDQTTRLTVENIDAFLGKRKYYFGYGANMDLGTIRKRCPSAQKIGIGVKRNYKLVFNRKGSYRPGGVSSIEPSLNDQVFGVIYSITDEDLSQLDQVEDPKAYLREEINIELQGPENRSCRCHVYLAYRVEDLGPDPDYLELIISAAQKVGLPQWYVNDLKNL